ncbi:FixH family protein [Bacillus sp. FJAT-49732]|uniref:FixH family protein n=1 Tax=Lederbergia citrisecunda TaxID=2833583 RepID=A0A942YK58_9BACI|nr:FixH family protein [Lederbergia citrisecunda]MBS4198260.1 FixH family protein [Lederbergia citrisecunda]
MKKRIAIISIIMLVLMLAACNSSNNNSTDDEIPKMLEVNLQVQEKADVNAEVPFTATVTQGDEKVKDADKVEFEVWEEGKKDDSEMIEAINKKDGTYEAKKTFDHDGVFTVQVHVTARGLHTMPKTSVTVGEGATEEHAHDNHEDGDHDDHGNHEHGHHSEDFSMHFMEPDSIEKGKETEFVVHLQDHNEPLEHARVRYEIWNDEISDKHEWVDASETKPGEYAGSHDFSESGVYKFKIHVQNDEGLHEHEEYEVVVK